MKIFNNKIKIKLIQVKVYDINTLHVQDTVQSVSILRLRDTNQ